MHEKKGKSPLTAKFLHKSHLMCMDILQRQAFSCRFLGIKGNGNPLRHADIINRRLLFKIRKGNRPRFLIHPHRGDGRGDFLE